MNKEISDDTADGAAWDWDESAGAVDEGDDLGLDNAGKESGLDDADDSLADNARVDVSWWKPSSVVVNVGELLGSNASLAETKLGADIKSLNTLFDPLHDGWDILLDDGSTESAVWRLKLQTKLINSGNDLFFSGLLGDETSDEIDRKFDENGSDDERKDALQWYREA